MARGGRRKVSIYTQRDRANKRWLKKVEKAVLPSRRTQRAIVRAAFTPTGSSSHLERSVQKPKVKLSTLQWIICIISGCIWLVPVFASGAFDGSGAAVAVAIVFFGIPFLITYLICWAYTASFVMNGIEPKKKKDKPTVQTQPKIINEAEPPKEEPDDVTVEVYDAHVTNPEWMGDYVEISDKLNAEILAPQLLKQVQDSLRILNTTTNPEVFFQRYDFIVGRLSLLKDCEKYMSFSGGETAHETYHRFKHQEYFDSITVSMVHRVEEKYRNKIDSLKTKKAKLNWAGKFYDEFIPYLGIMGVQAQTEAGEISAKLYDLADADPLEA